MMRIDIKALAALIGAAGLRTLTLEKCAATKVEATALRVALPPLPNLRSLVIEDSDDARLTTAEAEPLTRGVLARCTQLRRVYFEQNLL